MSSTLAMREYRCASNGLRLGWTCRGVSETDIDRSGTRLSTVYAYDPVGNLTATTTPDGRTISIAYDDTDSRQVTIESRSTVGLSVKYWDPKSPSSSPTCQTKSSDRFGRWRDIANDSAISSTLIDPEASSSAPL